MSANRIAQHLREPAATTSPAIPAGFAVCQLNPSANSPLALQLLAQQQAYEQALTAAREEALRVTLSRLKTSLN